MLISWRWLGLEGIVGVVRGVSGRTSDIVYDLFFGGDKMVAAVVLYFSDLNDGFGASSLLTMLFGGLWSRRKTKMQSARLMEERRMAFENKPLNQILALHEASFEIDYESVVSVLIKKGLLETSMEFVLQGKAVKKVRFGLRKDQLAEIEGLVDRVLPGKLRING
jgi:hypothetical protein